MQLNPEIVFNLVRSEDEFPVDFDLAWEWTGYSRKSDAKNALLNAGFIDGIDFQVLRSIPQNPKGGRPAEKINLTIDCFKSFAMMAGTERGYLVRRYFIECEKELKRRLQADCVRHQQRVLRAVVSDESTTWRKRYEDDFFEEAYRITGWKRTSKGHPSCMGRFINENVYDLFPDGTTECLRQVNPANDKGNRSRRHHQHLTGNIGLPLLDYQKGVTIAVMRLSPANSPKRFKSNMQRACGQQIQIELPFMDDLESAS